MSEVATIHIPVDTILGLACKTCDAPWPCSHSTERLSATDPLKSILENAVDAREAVYMYVWDQHYFHVQDEARGVEWADEEAEQILTIIFPFFKDILRKANRKAWGEGAVSGYLAGKHGTTVPESPYNGDD